MSLYQFDTLTLADTLTHCIRPEALYQLIQFDFQLISVKKVQLYQITSLSSELIQLHFLFLFFRQTCNQNCKNDQTHAGNDVGHHTGGKTGETFDVSVTFPDGYSDSTDANGNTVTLSGQKAVFTVVLNYISESVLPELTDSWVASTFGTSNNIYTVEALRAYYQDQLYTSNLNTAVMDDLLENSTFKSIPQQVMDYQVNQCLNYYSTLAGYYGYDLDGLVQNLLGYENTDAMLAHLESNLEDYSKEALLYQAVAESLDIAPTQEQIDTYSAYADTYGQNYCTMVALMDAVTSTLTSGAVVS